MSIIAIVIITILATLINAWVDSITPKHTELFRK